MRRQAGQTHKARLNENFTLAFTAALTLCLAQYETTYFKKINDAVKGRCKSPG